MLVYIRMIDAGDELDLGRAEGVVVGELDFEFECTTRVGGLLGADDLGLPPGLVVFVEESS